jgi:hypothetical protein
MSFNNLVFIVFIFAFVIELGSSDFQLCLILIIIICTVYLCF